MKVVRVSALSTGRLYPSGNILGTESTPGPKCGRKSHDNEKFQWHYRESNPRFFDFKITCQALERFLSLSFWWWYVTDHWGKVCEVRYWLATDIHKPNTHYAWSIFSKRTIINMRTVWRSATIQTTKYIFFVRNDCYFYDRPEFSTTEHVTI
jgi:hypothetical protein